MSRTTFRSKVFFEDWAAGIYLARYFTGEEAGGRSRR